MDRKRIGYWAWELPRAPARWRRAAALFHEVWAPSRFVADAIAACGVRGTVRVMPHPVAPPAGVQRDRRRWGLPEQKPVVLAMADYRSSATRKNIMGSIDICRRAASAAQPLLLVIKAMEAPLHALGKIRLARSEHLDIRLITESLGEEQIQSLIASVDVLLSPHRSEGFGLTLAEALVAGTPPLATGWSGNMQFMSGLSELLIDYRLVPVRDPTGIYGQRDQVWAEPSISDGAAKLLRLTESAELRRRLSSRGAQGVAGQSEDWEAGMFGELVLAVSIGRPSA
jgi:glycosyltransferase involved in cell wall biosynthesis